MFSFLDLPDHLFSVEKHFTHCSQELVRSIESRSSKIEEFLVQAQDDLAEIVTQSPGIYWVSEGSTNLGFEGKRILAFEQNDCFGIDAFSAKSPFGFVQEFAVRVSRVPLVWIYSEMAADVEFSKQLVQLQGAYSQLLSVLLSTSPLLENPFEPVIINVDSGDVVITEGDPETDIFSVIRGKFEVSIQDKVVGDLREGEVFGVISAFTDGKRSATVTATSEGVLMKLPKEEFKSLVKQKPALITNLVESLSRSIVELDQQVLVQKS